MRKFIIFSLLSLAASSANAGQLISPYVPASPDGSHTISKPLVSPLNDDTLRR